MTARPERVPVADTSREDPCAPCRPLRADARRNRDRILQAAQEIFATEGLSVPIDDVAKRAGVGVGTLYRHFPTKEALFEAIVISRMEELTATAECLTTSADPGGAFFSFVAELGSVVATKRDLSDALNSAGVDVKARAAHVFEAFGAAVAHLLARAQDAGAVRADVTVPDLLGLVVGSCLASTPTPLSGDPNRMLAIVCDGLRPAPAGA